MRGNRNSGLRAMELPFPTLVEDVGPVRDDVGEVGVVGDGEVGHVQRP